MMVQIHWWHDSFNVRMDDDDNNDNENIDDFDDVHDIPLLDKGYEPLCVLE